MALKHMNACGSIERAGHVTWFPMRDALFIDPTIVLADIFGIREHITSILCFVFSLSHESASEFDISAASFCRKPAYDTRVSFFGGGGCNGGSTAKS